MPPPRRRSIPPTGFPALEPAAAGTGLLLLALALAWIAGTGAIDSLTATLRSQAIIVGMGLAASMACDLPRGLRNLIRTDWVCLTSLYFLTYVEFLFPQPHFDLTASGHPVADASGMVLLAMGCLAVARHFGSLLQPATRPAAGLPAAAGLSTTQWLCLFYFSAALGYLHMLLAVNFNPLAIIEEVMKPRFSQPWGRGKFGDWKALLFELSLFLNALPPVYGILFAKRKHLSSPTFILVTAIALFTLFTGFAGGTRNVFATYLAGMIGAYLLVQPRLQWKQLGIAGLAGGGMLYLATHHMLAFRQIGLGTYLKQGKVETAYEKDDPFFVDANLFNFAMLMEAFPARHPFIGLDLPYNALVRPIPRAIWPGKPEGLKVGIEEAVGMEGLTLSVTFVGEAYMSAGVFGVALSGLLFGGMCAAWNRAFRHRHNAFSQLLYAAGFLPAAISMRSLMVFTTTVLPIAGLLAIAYFLRNMFPDPATYRPRKNKRKSSNYDQRQPVAKPPQTGYERPAE